MAALFALSIHVVGLALSTYSHPMTILLQPPILHQPRFPVWFPYQPPRVVRPPMPPHHFMKKHHIEKERWNYYNPVGLYPTPYGVPNINPDSLGPFDMPMSAPYGQVPYRTPLDVGANYYSGLDPNRADYGPGPGMSTGMLQPFAPSPLSNQFGSAGFDNRAPVYPRSIVSNGGRTGRENRRRNDRRAPRPRRVLSGRQGRGRPLNNDRKLLVLRENSFPRIPIPSRAQLKRLPDGLLKTDIKKGLLGPKGAKGHIMAGVPNLPNMNSVNLNTFLGKKIELPKMAGVLGNQRSIINMGAGGPGPMNFMKPSLQAVMNIPIAHKEIGVNKLNNNDLMKLSLTPKISPQKQAMHAMGVANGLSALPLKETLKLLDIGGPVSQSVAEFSKRKINGATMYSVNSPAAPGHKKDTINAAINNNMGFGDLVVPPSVAAAADLQTAMMLNQIPNSRLSNGISGIDLTSNNFLGQAGGTNLDKTQFGLNMDLLGIQFPPTLPSIGGVDMPAAADMLGATGSVNPMMSNFATKTAQKTLDMMKDVLTNEKMGKVQRMIGQNNIIKRLSAGMSGGGSNRMLGLNSDFVSRNKSNIGVLKDKFPVKL